MDKGESIASRLIGQDSSTGYIPPNIMDFPEDSPISQEDLMSLVMGISGGGGGKGIRNLLLAMKGKIKGGKMIPQQPFRQGMVGKPKPEYMSKEWREWEQLNKEISTTKNPEMKKYISRLREELSPYYKGPQGSWHQGRFNPNYESPTSGLKNFLVGTTQSAPSGAELIGNIGKAGAGGALGYGVMHTLRELFGGKE